MRGWGALAATLSLILGIHAAAGDLQHGLMRDCLLIAPRRGRLLAAKLAVIAFAGAGLGTASALLAKTSALAASKVRR